MGKKRLSNGRGGQMVSVVAFYSDDMSSMKALPVLSSILTCDSSGARGPVCTLNPVALVQFLSTPSGPPGLFIAQKETVKR